MGRRFSHTEDRWQETFRGLLVAFADFERASPTVRECLRARTQRFRKALLRGSYHRHHPSAHRPRRHVLIQLSTKSRRARKRRRWLALHGCGGLRSAAFSTSCFLCTEALPVELDQAQVQRALRVRKELLTSIGRSRWDRLRMKSSQLLEGLTGASPRHLSLLHRLVSLCSGRKHGLLSEELAGVSKAVVEEVLRREGGDEGVCSICLAAWTEDDKVLVPAVCGHALHVDCFWRLVVDTAGASGYAGHCRTCRSPHYWPPLARSNLVCTLVAAVAPALLHPDGVEAEEVAHICVRISEEVGTNPQQVLAKLKEECHQSQPQNPLSAGFLLQLKAELNRLAAARTTPRR